jgi:LDH2 family malate/lactate/ureidoglycolate dehydrogenase
VSKSNGHVVVSEVALRSFAEAVFERSGLAAGAASLAADVLIEADLRGVHSHGVQELPTWARGFLRGELSTQSEFPVASDAGSMAIVDAGGGLGALACHSAMRLTIAKAEENGVAMVGVRNSSHFGMAGYFAMQALPHDQIGYCTTNGPAVMAAWGGRRPVLCNNPFAYAIPANREPPIVLDMACSAVARGRVRAMARDGIPIPLGWAIDKDGRETTDGREAMEGAVLPIGGYKGYGMAVVNEVLAGPLVGALFSFEIARSIQRDAATELSDKTQKAWACGHWLAAIDLSRIVSPDEFKQRVDELIRTLRDSPLAEGAERVYLPGEIEHERKIERRREGIPLPASTIELLDDFRRRDLKGQIDLDVDATAANSVGAEA